MEIEVLSLSGVMRLKPARHGDARGWFSETWSTRALESAGITTTFVQDNVSFSAAAGTVRGLHYQAPPSAQAKLVMVLTGGIRDAVVDVRVGSPTYGRRLAVDLRAETGDQLLVPEGFLHGFVTTQPDTRVLYKVSAPYDPAADGAVRWDDPDLGIDWGLDPAAAVVSAKDSAAPAFRDWTSPFTHSAGAAQ